MTDEQRVAENTRVSAFLEAAEAERQRELFMGFGAIGGLAMVLGGALWAAIAWPTKT